MDLSDRARLLALELLVTHLVADRLRALPHPEEGAARAREMLHRQAEEMPLDAGDLDEEARLRLGVKAAIGDVLAAARERAMD